VIRRSNKAPQLRRLATATAFILAAGASQAAIKTDLHGQDVARLNAAYKAATKGMTVAGGVHERHANLLGLDAESALVQTHKIMDKDGTAHYRYQQTFRGIPVWGESIAVAEKDGNVRSVFGNRVDRLANELPANAATPVIAHGRALALGAHVARQRSPDLAIASAFAAVSFALAEPRSAARPLTWRPNRFSTSPLPFSVTTTCSPHTGMPRKVCW